MIASFAIVVPPRTKKNHGSIWRPNGGRMRVVPSEAYRRFEASAVPQLRIAWAGRAPICEPVNVRAIFYRDAERGDAVGYYQALADTLEKAGVLRDDKWIVSWDGSRLSKDADRPRVEVEIEEVR